MEIFDDGTSLLTIDEQLPYERGHDRPPHAVRLRRFALAG
jgi:hypothetical protein